MQARHFWVLITGLTLLGCNGSSSNSNSSNNDTLSTGAAAVCQILSAGNATVVCIDFAANNVDNQTACNTSVQAEYAPQGAIGSEYISPTSAQVSITCALNNSGLTIVGNCLMSDRAIRYYSGDWTTTSSQVNCNAVGGTWSTN